MSERPQRLEAASTNSALPVAPSMGPQIQILGSKRSGYTMGPRALWLCAMSCGIGSVAALVAQLLGSAIGFITNLAFYGKISFEHSSPAGNNLGWFVVLVPILGALIVGMMARYGSAAIRGHGIPEAMEQVLFNQSRIPARVFFLKPLSAVISIGTGGPFGAEGPIIATGGALGSLVGQFSKISGDERKTLLAAGAAAGMSATFGSPVAAVLLAIELLLFEYRSRSLIPVALAAVVASGIRISFEGMAPAFAVNDLPAPTSEALIAYVAIGAIAGLASVLITKAVYGVEDAFEKLPIHWMWWPALGAIPVGVIGFYAPRTMGVGYDNIEEMVSGSLTGSSLLILCTAKLISWLFSLGSGTSGGTLAPLFTVGGGIGAGSAWMLSELVPGAGIDLRIGALVGMAALFAGASRALLASVVFAFEATRQPLGLLPLLGGCSAAYLLSCLLMKNSIMTEKIARRGRPIPSDYAADPLQQLRVQEIGLRPLVSLHVGQSLKDVRQWLQSGVEGTRHQGFPVIDLAGRAVGLLTKTRLWSSPLPDETSIEQLVQRPLVAVRPEATLRDAADIMLNEKIGRLPIVDEDKLIGIVTRSDLLEGHRARLVGETDRQRTRAWRFGT